ncbi:amidohydrolase family protein [Solwaraspora sp. WMMB762]|uniref:amidohydrolase family protein n=1 Tax=Solwaraspora sp. WMMB762 TaxID=3404120 RepID=UPI003B963B9A
MERADAHLHLFADGYPGRYGRSPSGGQEISIYQDIRREHGISRALVVGYEGEPRFAGNNHYLASLAAVHEWLAPVAYLHSGGPKPGAHRDDHIDPIESGGRRGQTGDTAPGHWLAAGFVGFAAYLGDRDSADWFADWLTRHTATVNRAHCLLSVNAVPAAVARLGPALAAVGDCTVLFSHLGLPGRQPAPPAPSTAAAILAPLGELARLPHVGVKVSGLYAVSDPPYDHPHAAARPFVEQLIEWYGPQRLYWGSDFPPCLDHVSFAQTLDPVGLAGLSAGERADVAGRNLLRALGDNG